MATLKDVFIIDGGLFGSPMNVIDVAVKSEYSENYVKGAPRKQELKNGVPIWHVTVLIKDYGTLRVSVPSEVKPEFEMLQEVAFENLRIGRGNTAYWALADEVVALEFGK